MSKNLMQDYLAAENYGARITACVLEKSRNRFFSLLNGPWMIRPDCVDALLNRANSLFQDVESMNKISQEFVSKKNNGFGFGFDVIGGTAIINIKGVIVKDFDPVGAMFFGEVSTDMIKIDIQKALVAPKVKKIVLNFDSPGGTVSGTKELSDFIFNSRGSKPIISFTENMMASAAYFIGSAADKGFGFDTSIIGSLGILMVHFDTTKMMDTIGIKPTIIRSVEKKALVNQLEKLDEKAFAAIKMQVDELHEILVADVARNRGVDIETVKSKMADGSVFIGQKAMNLGLIDGVVSFDELISVENQNKIIEGDDDEEDDEKEDAKAQEKNIASMVMSNGNTVDVNFNLLKGNEMDEAKLQADFPELYNSVLESGKKSAEESAVLNERKRVISIYGSASVDQKELAFSLIKEGKNQEEAKDILLKNAQESKLLLLKEFSASAPEIIHNMEGDNLSSIDGFDPALFSSLKEKWQVNENTRKEFGNNFESYLWYHKGNAILN